MAATIYAKNFTVSIDSVNIGKIMMDGVPQPEPEAEEVDDTTQDSGNYYEILLGRIKSGEADLTCRYDPDDAGQTALLNAYAALTSHSFIITYPGSIGALSFTAFVKKASIVTVDKKVGLKCKLTVSGGTAFSGTATKLTTPYFVVKDQAASTITALAPVAGEAPGTYMVYAANTVTSVTVTPTCATSGATITVDGTTVATNVASESKSVAASSIRTILVKVTKSGETVGIYRILVGRAA